MKRRIRKNHAVYIPVIAVLSLLAITFFLTRRPEPDNPSSTFVKAPFGSGWEFQTRGEGSLQTSLKAGAVEVRLADSGVRFELPFAKSGIIQTDNQIVMSGTAVETRYSAEPNRIKEEIRLSQPPTSNTFTMPLKTRNVDIYLTPQNLPVFFDQGVYQFHIEAPFATDAKGNKTYAAAYRLQINNQTVTYPASSEKKDLLANPIKVSQPGATYQLVLEVDSTWLESASYPVTIDPTITHDTQTEFSGGTKNRVGDAGTSDNSPALQDYYQELGADQHTVGLWHLNESSGNALDASGNNNTGTPTGTTIVSGLLGNARSFNGTSDYMTLSTTPTTGTSSFTINAWIKTSSTGTRKDIVSYGTAATNNGLFLHVNTTNQLKFDLVNTSGPTSTVTVTDGLWHHVAVTNTSGLVQLYVDGLPSGTTVTMSPNIVAANNNYVIGKSFSSTYYFNGLIDEVSVSNVARSPDEIKAAARRRPSATYTSPAIDLGRVTAYDSIAWTASGSATSDAETPFDTSSLVAQWNFNETSGTTAASDGSCGATCNGTLTNFAATGSQDAAPLSGWTGVNRRWGTGALMFDGSDDIVTVTQNGSINVNQGDSFSVETWVNPRVTNAEKFILNKQQNVADEFGYTLKMTSSGYPYFEVLKQNVGATSVTGTTVLRASDWFHLTATSDGTTIKLYVNGKLEQSTAISITGATQSAANLSIGQLYNGTLRWAGIIDSTRIYSRTLSPAEILSNYAATRMDMQTRTSSDGVHWEMWKPSTTETQLLSFDSEALSWSNVLPSLRLANDSARKIQGSSSLKLQSFASIPAATNLASGKQYSVSPSASALFPDTGSVELTDGLLTSGWNDNRSFGHNNTSSTIVVDLTSSQTLTQVAVLFGSGTSSGVYFPATAEVSFSTDNVTFANATNLTCPTDTLNESASWCKTSFDPLAARYVKVVVTQGGASQWTMWGELKAGNGDLLVGGQWRLDETGGSGAYLKDTSGNTNHLTLNGTSIVSGVAGKARLFDDVDDYLEAADNDSLDLTTNGTIEAWIKTNANEANNWFVCKDGNYCLGVNATGALLFTGASAQDNAGTSLLSGRWHQVVVTNDGTTVSYYVDGAAAGTDTVGWGATLTNPLRFGRDGGTNYFDGVIDEVKISPVLLTANEVADRYRMGRDVRMTRATTTDLSAVNRLPFWVASDKKGQTLQVSFSESAYANYETDANTHGLWHMEELSGTGSYLTDSSGNGRHSVPTGTRMVPGALGKGRWCNGSERIDYTATSIPTNTFTMEAWFMPTTTHEVDGESTSGFAGTSGQRYLFAPSSWGGNPGAGISVGTNGIGVYEHASSYLPALAVYSGTIPPGWNQVVVTYNNKQPSIYLNGTLVRVGLTSPRTTVYAPFVVCWGDYGNHIGGVDEVRISNNVRTAEEIRQAYEIGKRSHQVTIDFAASLDSGNLITASNDLSFTVDETGYGVSAKAGNLFSGDKIIVKENYDGTEYLAQGEVSSVNSSTGAVTVLAWESGSTFPTGGYSVNASVFKWQREYMDLTGSMPHHRDSITKLTLQPLDGLQGGTLWLDDLMTATPYLDTPAGETIPSTLQRYFQYKTVFSTSDTLVSAGLASVSLTYTTAFIPPTNCRIETSAADTLTLRWTDTTTDETGFEIERNVDGAGFSALTTTGADSASYADDTIVSGHTYAYRVRTYKTGDPTEYTAYCTTATSDVSTGLFEVEGLEMEGVDLE